MYKGRGGSLVEENLSFNSLKLVKTLYFLQLVNPPHPYKQTMVYPLYPLLLYWIYIAMLKVDKFTKTIHEKILKNRLLQNMLLMK